MKAEPSTALLREAQTPPRLRALARAARRRWLLTLLIASNLAAMIYWGLIASDRYVSEVHLVIARTDTVSPSPAGDIVSLLSGTSASHDVLLFQDRMLSVDMMRSLDEKLHLRQHYSDHSHDLISRLWSSRASDETFRRYYLSRVTTTYDDYAQILNVKVEAYTPQMAQQIARTLVAQGEAKMNAEDNALAAGQVRFIETEVAKIRVRMTEARQKLLAFQNANGLVSPATTVESVSEVVARLEAERADLNAKKRAMAGYLTATAPDMVMLDSQVSAIQQQINAERSRLASQSGSPLNHLAEKQERLQAEAIFIEEVYRTALSALEKARVESTRKIKSVNVLQSANLPQDSMEPRRLYNIIVFALVSLLVAGIISLLGAIIRDHRD